MAVTTLAHLITKDLIEDGCLNQLHKKWRDQVFVDGDNVYSALEYWSLVAYLYDYLGSLGLGKKDFVVIAASKTIPMVALIYACVLRGIVFVPVDKASPKQRFLYIIRDCKPSAVFLDNDSITLTDDVQEIVGKVFVFADQDSQSNSITVDIISFQAASASHLVKFARDYDVNFISPDDWCYVMYTSGSTGTPKGVVVDQKAIASFIKSSIRRAGYAESTVFLSFFPFHFDPVLMEIFAPFIVGGTTVLFGDFTFINELVNALEKYSITDFSCTPNVITMLVHRFSGFRGSHCDTLRSIWSGGEKPNPKDIHELCQIAPHIKLFNGYGPTETIVACSLHEIEKNDLHGEIPIGKPMDEVEFLLLNNGSAVENENEQGEICVGGLQLMVGYLNNGMIQDKKIQHNNKLYYQTGDIGYRKGETYYYCGRINSMIKIRGYRIFPDEVEAAFNNVDYISASHVFLDEKHMRLLGVLEITKESIFDDKVSAEKEIRLKVQESLPDYMVPEELIFCHSLPRNSNGKLNLLEIKNLAS